MFKSSPQKTEVRVGWIGVDLDGTLVRFGDWRGADHVAPPIPAMSERVKKWLSEGRDVRIFTARVAPLFSPGASKAERQQAEKARRAIEDWCEEHFGNRLNVTAVKDMEMQLLYDDRCVPVETDTGRVLGDPLSGMSANVRSSLPFLFEPRTSLLTAGKPLRTAASTRTRKAEPSKQDSEHARLFAEWQLKARKRNGWNIRRLVDVTGYTDAQVRLFDAEGHAGLDITGRFRRPSIEYIETVARVTGSDHAAGLVAAGEITYDHPHSRNAEAKEAVPPVDAEDSQFYAAYRDLPPAHKEIVKMLAETLNRAGGKK